MKRLSLIAAWLAASSAISAATLTPVQLLNPSGSTAGQAIVSNGPSSAPTWQAVSVSSPSGTLPIANGGTGATNAVTAMSNLGAAPLSGAAFTGAVSIGYSSSSLTINDTSGANAARVNFQSGGVLRWDIGNAGFSSNAFALDRYNSGGTYVDTPITVSNSTGGATFSVRPVFAGATPWDSANLNFSAPPAIGGTTPNSGAFTTLSATSTVSGSGFTTYLASPPAIGGTAPNAGAFTALTANATSLGGANVLTLTNTTAGTGALIRMVGDGATTPTKTVRALGGNFQIINDAYSAAILSLTDGGSLTTTGGINGTSVGMGTPAAGAFTSLSASSNAKVIATNTAGQTVASGGSGTVITNWTKTLDATNSFNTTTGVFTAPAAGQYLVTVALRLGGVNWTAAQIYQIVLNKNGALAQAGIKTIETAGVHPTDDKVTFFINLAANDTLTIAISHNGGSSGTVDTNANINTLGITRIP